LSQPVLLMIEDAIKKLSRLTEEFPELLKGISEMRFSSKPAPNKWSKKEILGHLIDSATNNHHRFIRVQFEHKPAIFYDQNNWVAFNHYNELTAKQLIKFWTVYNKHLIEVLKRIPEENLDRVCKMRNGDIVTLDFLINDYVAHLEHHLNQMFD
jgi:hypothetical protein